MPVQIIFPPGTTQVGPGYSVHLVSDFIGPLPTGALWVLKISTAPEPLVGNIHCFFPATAKEIRFTIGTRSSTTVPVDDPVLVAGQTAYVTAELQNELQVPIDSGSRSDLTYDPVGQLWSQINQNTTTVQGGFTASDRQLLEASERRTQLLGEPTDLVIGTPSGPVPFTLGALFSRNLLDTLTLQEVTSGPTCEPVRFVYNDWYAGVVVRVTTIDPALTPRTPDQDWYFPDLAVLRVFRGQDLKFRRGIHTPTFMTDERWEWNWNIRNVVELLGGPPATTVAVDWRVGCCGQVFLLRFP